MSSLVGEADDCSVSISNLLSEQQGTWSSSLSRLRVATIAHFEDPQQNQLPPIRKNDELIDKLKSFILPSSDPTLRLDAIIILSTLFKKQGDRIRDLPNQIVNFLIDALTNNEDKSMICSILIALGEVALSGNERRHEMARRNILNLLQTCHVAAQGDIEIIRAIMRFFSCLFEQKARIPSPLTILPLLSESLHSSDVKAVGYAAHAVSSLLENHIEEVLSADTTIAPTLTQLMLHPAKEVVVPALRGVGNIMTGDDVQTQRMIELQVIPSLLWLVEYPDKEVQKEAVWTLSNIAAGTKQQIQAVIDAGVIPKVIPLLDNWKKETKIEKDLFKEAVWLICNLCEGGSPDQKRILLNENLLERFYELLKNHEQIEERSIIQLLVNFVSDLVDVGLRAEYESTRKLTIEFLQANDFAKFFADLQEVRSGVQVYRMLDVLESIHENNEV